MCFNTSKSPKEITFVPCPFGLIHPMPTNKTPMASVEQSMSSKVPILTAGDITPAIMRQFKHGHKNYFIHKKIITNNQVPLIIGRLLNSHVSDWISADCDHIITLSFNVFMVEFHANYLSEDWAEDTLHELLSMTQGSTSFWDVAVAVQSKNSLLHGTPSHLPDNKLCHQINMGMEIRLSVMTQVKISR
jgi:hypothetical protein